MKVLELWDRLLCLLYPQRCVLCDDVVEYGELWCGRCPVPTAELSLGKWGDLTALLSPLHYEGCVRQAVLRLKRQPDRRLARFFAQRMERCIQERWQWSLDLVVPVPLNPAKRILRGFNQAELLAEELGELLGVALHTDGLQRLDDTQIQHTLSASKRGENARQSFALLHPNVQGKRVLLVDDVHTTGATLGVCATLLRQAGAQAVYAVAAASPPGKLGRTAPE